MVYSYIVLSAGMIVVFRIIEIEYIYRLITKIFLLLIYISLVFKLKIFLYEDFTLLYKKIQNFFISQNKK